MLCKLERRSKSSPIDVAIGFFFFFAKNMFFPFAFKALDNVSLVAVCFCRASFKG